jgi:hypothetical protein
MAENDSNTGAAGTVDGAEDAATRALTELENELDVVEVDDEGNETPIGDERLGSEAQTREAESQEAKRLRRREERHTRKDTQRRLINEGRQAMRENAELRARIDAMDRRLAEVDQQQVGYGVVQLEGKIQEVTGLLRQMEQTERAALAANTPQGNIDAAEARTLAAQARDQLRDLNSTYRQVGEEIERRRQTQGQQTRPTQQAQTRLDPAIVDNFKEFHKDNPWYNPDVRVVDQDSMVVRAIEAAMAASGSDPRDPEHWDELEDRLVSALPHRYNGQGQGGDNRGSARRDDSTSSNGRQQQQVATRRERPPVGNGRDQGTGGSRRTVRISPERKAAMVEAGTWDDPVERAKQIREYARWDAANPDIAIRQ